MSIASAALGLSQEFTCGAISLQLHPLTYEDCARLSDWLIRRSRIECAQMAEMGIDGNAVLRAHLDNVASCQYEPGGASFEASIRTEAGYRKMLEQMIVGTPEEKESLSWEVLSDVKAFKEVQPLVAELNSNPLAQRARRTPAPKHDDRPSR